MSTALAVISALAAACCFAIGSVLQQGVARQSGEGILRLRLLLALLRQPRWVGGFVLGVGSFAIQGLALAFGPLTLVQPLAATDVLFALPLIARRSRRRLTGQDMVGVLAVTTGIAVFLVVSPPAAGHSPPGPAAWIPVFAGIGALAGGSAVAALRTRGPARVVWLAAAAGALYGLMDALTKNSVDILTASGAAVLTAWEPYALFGAAVCATLFGQSAFGAGALSLSLPVIDSVEPVTAVAIGATIFGEALAASPAHLTIQLAAGAAAVAGIVVLSHSSVVENEAGPAPDSARGARTGRGGTAGGGVAGADPEGQPQARDGCHCREGP